MSVTKFKILLIISIFITTVSFTDQKKIVPKEITVYIFLSETCPICQSYTLTLKGLSAKFKPQHVLFVGVFPDYYSTQQSISEFKKKYEIPFKLTLDKKGIFTGHFKATITPEVFIEDGDHQLLYSGRIDDAFYSPGKRRTIISSTELEDALTQIVSGMEIKSPTTQAVGCIINASK
jgi:thiol-disulfide isomerase/thioredoxin